jgi:hypothetical protein
MRFQCSRWWLTAFKCGASPERRDADRLRPCAARGPEWDGIRFGLVASGPRPSQERTHPLGDARIHASPRARGFDRRSAPSHGAEGLGCRVGAKITCDTRCVETGGGDSLARDAAGRATAAVDLYWLPLGAGGRFVRLNGRVYEALAARLQRRPACDLYHSALQVEVAQGTLVIEQAPVHDWSGKQRGVVGEGAVGSRWAGRFRIFRYEIRLWFNGHIPDVAEAVDSPRRLTNDEDRARRVLDLVARVPTPVWGRDELATGEMWNSNSVIAWVIARSGIDTEFQPPAGGRAPGWMAGLVVARRQDEEEARSSRVRRLHESEDAHTAPGT